MAFGREEVYTGSPMTKHSQRPKIPAPARSPLESVDPVSLLPNRLPPGPKAKPPHRVAEDELDPPEPGVDPTLPTNPVDGAPGHQVKEPASEDEDEEGRSTTEQLAEEGAQQAEQDTVNQASRAGSKKRS